MEPAQRPQIAIILDDRISREKGQILTRVVNTLRTFAQVQLLSAAATEEETLAKIRERPYKLVLAPWYRYLQWRKLEGHFGLTRVSGPTFAGYFADGVTPEELTEKNEYLRSILLDFTHLQPKEVLLLIRALVEEPKRSGILPLIGNGAPIYQENWFQGQGPGARLDTVLSLPEIAQTDWNLRANGIRLCLTALWSLIYDEGPGKSDMAQGAKAAKAHLQIGVAPHCLAFRLCFAMPNWTPKDVVAAFWPDDANPTSAAQLLLRYTDFIRVHLVHESSNVELVAGFLPSAPADTDFRHMHTIWVDPISPNLITEAADNGKPLPSAPVSTDTRGLTEDEKAKSEAKDRFIFQAAMKIRELKKEVAAKDEQIHELRSGGVGTAKPLPPPDAEALLEAFQHRYFEAKYEIRQLELQIDQAEKKGASPKQLEHIHQKINNLMTREQAWIEKIAGTIELYKEARKARSGGD